MTRRSASRSTVIDAAQFDLRRLPDDFYDDPFPYYRALRERSPVHRCDDGSVLLSRYADVVAVYADAARFSSDKRDEFKPKFGDRPLYRHHTTSLVFNDAPRHTRIRRRIVGALSARTVGALRADLTTLVETLLQRLATLAAAGRPVDLVDEFAARIPVEVIGNLLRVPRAERGPLRDWSLAILGALEPAVDAAALDAGDRAVIEFSDYLRRLVAARRRALNDADDDILSRLLRAGETPPLDEQELLQNCIFILNAGHETTTNLIANGVEALLRHPDQLARLRAEPALIDDAVEELLRFESPNQLGNRVTREPVEIGAARLAAGTRVTLMIGAANRDPTQFEQPDRLDIGRRPNRHLAFAAGVHACAGLNVARLEARTALLGLLQRFPRLRAGGDPLRARRARFRGLLSLPVLLV